MNDDILKIYEFKENVINCINNSELPAVIVNLVLKDLLSETEKIEDKQYQQLKKKGENE